MPLGHSSIFFSALFSPDGKKIAVSSVINNTPKILSPSSRNPFIILKGHTQVTVSSEFSPDSKKIVTTSMDSTAKIWDTETGALLGVLRGHTRGVVYADFSRDGKRIVTASDDGTAKVWEWDGMKWSTIMTVLKDSKVQAYSASFSLDGTKIVTGSADDTVRIWDVATGHLDRKLIGHRGGRAGVMSVKYSPDGTKIVSASDRTAIIWNAKTGVPIKHLLGHTDFIYTAQFSWDGRQIITASNDGKAKVWDAVSGKLLRDITGHTDEVKSARFSVDGTRIITASYDHTIKVWDAVSTKCLYTFYAVDSTDYLVVDNESHYDGTEAARKLLYFTCGKDTIDLSQVKDQLWVPKLSERINNGETINAKSLNELDICGLTPEVKEVSRNPEEYYFTIKLRRGGLGDLNLSINGIIADTYQPERLTKNGDVYEFTITKKDFIPYLPEGQINKISLKAYTADNTISSREITISIDKTEKPAPPPNLFAVMVGVSDYKGDKMDLDFAAIDATDISNALKDAAVKLLGKEHVFMYNLTTAKERYMLPEKNSIKKVLEDIGKKATANDILFIFLSGHGVMEGEGKKLFYYMTADAADFDAYAVAGISTTELTEWIKPQNIKAQKRILILDACHSGQAINDFVKLGDGIPAAKGDDKGQQIKAIDKLNEKSGLFILSASASDKSAFESQIHSHGYLTYSLLKAIKEQPDILEDGKFLNISRWFNAAGKTVSEVAKEEGVGQQTQIVSNTDFNIGLVDDEVMGKIKLLEGKQVFSASNFQNNDVAADGDDLEMSRTINQSLQESSSKEIIYAATASSSNAYSLSGRYDVKDNAVTISFSIKKNNKTLFRFEKETGAKDKLRELADKVVTMAVEWVVANKANN